MTSENIKPAGKTNVFARPVVLCLLLVAATFAVYWPVTHYDFVNYDDPDYFTANPHVLSGVTAGNVVWAFTTGHASNWHPLTWLSLMLDVEFFGKGPAGPHFTNLFFHARQCGPAFSFAPAPDRGDLAERLRGRAVRLASVARRIGGMDFGAQRRLEHIFRAAGACFLHPLRSKAVESRAVFASLRRAGKTRVEDR